MQNIGSARNQRPVIIFPLNYALCFFGRNGGDFLFLPAKLGKGILAVCLVFQRHRPFHLQAHQSPASFFQRVSVTYGSAYMQSRTLITVSLFFLKLSGSVAQHFIIISRARSIERKLGGEQRVSNFFL